MVSKETSPPSEKNRSQAIKCKGKFNIAVVFQSQMRKLNENVPGFKYTL